MGAGGGRDGGGCGPGAMPGGGAGGVGTIAGGISSSCLEGGNGGRAVGAGRGRKLGGDCGAGAAPSSDCCARDARGAAANIAAASITSPAPRPIAFVAC